MKLTTLALVGVCAGGAAFTVSRDASAQELWTCNVDYQCVGASQNGTGPAVRGAAAGGIGVEGTSNNNDGMHAVTYHSSHSGIYAQNLATSGGGYGVYAGVGGNGQAVHGQNTNSTGWAGYFDGKVYASQGFTSSDARLKKDITDLLYGLRDLSALRPVTFKWKDPNRGDGRHLGFLAQDLQKIVPEIVDKDAKTGLLAVDYPALVPVLVKAIQEQETEIRHQEARIASLEQHPIISSMFSEGTGLLTVLGALAALLFAAVRTRRYAGTPSRS